MHLIWDALNDNMNHAYAFSVFNCHIHNSNHKENVHK